MTRAGEGVDLDDLTRCPLGDVCHHCGKTATLRLATYATPLGVFCATVCASCLIGNRIPALASTIVVHRVADHCDHLAITFDEMAAVLQSEATSD